MFEDDIEGNSSWEEGDWNGDGDFTSDDLVLAFQIGLYERKAQAASIPDVASAVDWLFAHEDPRRKARVAVA